MDHHGELRVFLEAPLNGVRVLIVFLPDSMSPTPEAHVSPSHRSMENMIFGEVPDIEKVLVVLQTLQEEINHYE